MIHWTWRVRVCCSLLLVCCRCDDLCRSIITEDRLPLSTMGSTIADRSGAPVRLACVNWYGAHMELYAAGGLQVQPVEAIADQIRLLGFNCVRLPFSLEMYTKNAMVPAKATAANPRLQNMSAVDVFDATISAITATGLLVVLNNHNSRAGWCCDLNSEEGLWHTTEYPTEMWLSVLGVMTRRYRDNRQVVGFDIRNEIHDTPSQSIGWGSFGEHTRGDIESDWREAASRAADIILTENPNMLVIVGGLCSNWDLRPLIAEPIQPRIANKLIWTAHTYGFSLWWTILRDRLHLKSWADVAQNAQTSLFVLVALGAALFLFSARRFKRAQPARATVICSISVWSMLACLVVSVVAELWIYGMVTGAKCSASVGSAPTWRARRGRSA